MSDIDSPMTMALTVTRANKKPYTVKPLLVTDWAAELNAAKTVDELAAVWKRVPDKAEFAAVKDARKLAIETPTAQEI
jgi:hypothetical protein